MDLISKINRKDNMQVIAKVAVLSALVTTLVSCYGLTPKPTETPSPTATFMPTLTSTPEPTNTPIPIQATETPSDAGLRMPSGVPVSVWNGIPIMPNAIAGDGDSGSYYFTIAAPAKNIQAFYEAELGKLGWDMLAHGQGTTSAILLIFMKEGSTLSVAIIPRADNVMYVMLAK